MTLGEVEALVTKALEHGTPECVHGWGSSACPICLRGRIVRLAEALRELAKEAARHRQVGTGAEQMIRFTKDGKVDRSHWIDPARLRLPEGNALEENRRAREALKLADDCADALDVAVARMIAVVNHYEAYRGRGMLPAKDAYGELVRSIYDCRDALRQIGADQ